MLERAEYKDFKRTVAEKQRGKRIDQYLIASGIGISRSLTQKLIETGKVQVNGHSVKRSYRVKTDDDIFVHFEVRTAPQIKPENIPLEIVYEDESLIIVNKHKGIIVHPARGNFEHTMVNALLHHVVHRRLAPLTMKSLLIGRLPILHRFAYALFVVL